MHHLYVLCTQDYRLYVHFTHIIRLSIDCVYKQIISALLSTNVWLVQSLYGSYDLINNICVFYCISHTIYTNFYHDIIMCFKSNLSDLLMHEQSNKLQTYCDSVSYFQQAKDH